MKTWTFAAALLLSSTAFAAIDKSDECALFKRAQINMGISTSNLANTITTRTPDGGPYKAKEITSCTSAGCDVKTLEVGPLMKYEPGHPDADKNGYVAYPVIDKQVEYAVLDISAKLLRDFAKREACGAKAMAATGKSAIITYSKSSPIKEDIINFGPNDQIVSWLRVHADGKSTIANFNEFGKLVSYR